MGARRLFSIGTCLAVASSLILVGTSGLPFSGAANGASLGKNGSSRRIDVRDAATSVVTPSPDQQAALQSLGAHMQFNPHFGVPFVVMKDGGTLSGPNSQDPEQIARRFLRENAALWRVNPGGMAQLVKSSQLRSSGGATIIEFEQRDGPRRVFASSLKVTIDRQGQVVIVSGTLYPERSGHGNGALAAEAAIARAADGAGATVHGPIERAESSPPGKSAFKNNVARGLRRPQDVTAELVTFPVAPGDVRVAWEVALETGPSENYQAVVDASSGEVLFLENGVAQAEGTVFTGQTAGSGTRAVTPFPAGWVSSAATTSGPNVNAYQDLTNTNTVEYQPSTPASPDPNFQKYNYGFTNTWATTGTVHSVSPAGTTGYSDIDAAVTQMFYYTNIMHDFLVPFGFDSANRGFEGGDPVLAEATDGYSNGCLDNLNNPVRCRNNANFFTNADGTSPRMQMYLFENPPFAFRDGALDGDVIAHEYGHGLSGRLIANANLGNSVQTGALGEGWSDIVSATKWDDPIIGEYVTGNATTGIRNYSMAASPLKLSSLCTIGGGCEVHNDGEIWAATFWDMRTRLIARYGNSAKTLAFQLIVDGMKNTAAGPTFLSARDGILAADVADNAGANTCLIWAAFAGREMGYSATTTGNGDTNPVEATDVAPSCMPTAEANGPYNTNEGTSVAVNANGSVENGTAPFTYTWDLDNNGLYNDSTGKAVTFGLVGQDGTYTIGVKLTNADGLSSTDTATVNVANVAPTVAFSTDGPKPENGAVAVNGTVTDPGWLDSLTATVDWGDGAGPLSLAGTLENVAPDATLTFAPTHVYGDDGTFTIKICAADDDTTGNCTSHPVTVTNTAPTAAIDKSSTSVIGGLPTIIVKKNVPVPLSGRSLDPGSDDLSLSWSWGDGPPVPDRLITSFNNAPTNTPDPHPSPSVNPRDVTDATTHAFADACTYTVVFNVSDDDLGSAPSDSIAIIVTGNATDIRGAGYWQTQYQPRPTAFPEAQRLCYLAIVRQMSAVFNEVRPLSTAAHAFDVMTLSKNGGSSLQKLDRQLLTTWLNFANGSLGLATLVDTNGDAVPDTALATVIATAESVRLNPASTSAQLLAQAQLLERINGI